MSKRSKEELRERFRGAVNTLSSLLQHLPKTKDQTILYDYAATIAAKLRAFFCDVSGNKCLLKSCGLYEDFLFPCNTDHFRSANLLSSFLLGDLSLTINGSGTATTHFVETDQLVNEHVVPGLLAKTDFWLNEVIADLKSQDIRPLSRYDIIRAVADKDGAHVDENDDPVIAKIAQLPVFEVQFGDQTNPQKLFLDVKEFLMVNILAIAKEALWSFESTGKTEPRIIGPDKHHHFYIQVYECERGRPLYQMTPTANAINPYNSNAHFGCHIYELHPSLYQTRIRERYFSRVIVDFVPDSPNVSYMTYDEGYGKHDWGPIKLPEQ